MNALTAALKEELNVEMISLGGLQVPESVVVSWGIMLFLVIVSILLTRNLKVDHISRRQAILELVVTTIDNFFTGLLGEQGRLPILLPSRVSRMYTRSLVSGILHPGCLKKYSM